MPMLRKLNLHNIFICEELILFATDHMETLESITLTDCYAYDYNGSRPTYLKDLFDELVKANSTRLASFEIHSKHLDDPRKMLGLDYGWAGWDPDFLEQVTKKLKTGAKPFAYGYLDENYGTEYCDFESCQTALLRGDDERSYKRLMAMIASN
ncbi:hypothetical protein AJ80_00360 [Polytolypa hystricis UAMH7299]|uniref:Uncharacterized protein n=1 Tax=Polytolypa hystricis (strain UAMH7299) TaxID=1447883 RepID=A0A2B7Z4Y7_POLH7|nr:hypothetical protein AJ80_00360 [Polytolypa hystricis UAMH7299]